MFKLIKGWLSLIALALIAVICFQLAQLVIDKLFGRPPQPIIIKNYIPSCPDTDANQIIAPEGLRSE